MANCEKTSWKTGDMNDVLAQLQGSGSIHFQKSFARLQNRKFGQCEQLVIVLEEPHGPAQVKFAGGWKEFAADNRLEEGDSLIFVLKAPLPEPQFEVYIFRGTARSSESWKIVPRTRNLMAKHLLSTIGDQQHSVTFTGYGVEQNSGAVYREVLTGSGRKGVAFQHGTNSLPGFRKRLTATNIRKTPLSDNSTGRFEVPASIVQTHGMELQAHEYIKLQGIRDDSPVHFVKCYWLEQGESRRLYFRPPGWSGFVQDNGLQEGQELSFSLTNASSFVVRKFEQQQPSQNYVTSEFCTSLASDNMPEERLQNYQHFMNNQILYVMNLSGALQVKSTARFYLACNGFCYSLDISVLKSYNIGSFSLSSKVLQSLIMIGSSSWKSLHRTYSNWLSVALGFTTFNDSDSSEVHSPCNTVVLLSKLVSRN